MGKGEFFDFRLRIETTLPPQTLFHMGLAFVLLPFSLPHTYLPILRHHAIGLQLLVQCFAGDAEAARGLTLVAAGHFKGV